jgi:hypothetical protein
VQAGVLEQLPLHVPQTTLKRSTSGIAPLQKCRLDPFFPSGGGRPGVKPLAGNLVLRFDIGQCREDLLNSRRELKPTMTADLKSLRRSPGRRMADLQRVTIRVRHDRHRLTPPSRRRGSLRQRKPEEKQYCCNKSVRRHRTPSSERTREY